MRIVQFTIEKDPTHSRIGVLKGDVIVDCTSEGLPNQLIDLLSGDHAYDALHRAASKATKTYPLSGVKLLPPINKPDKVLCIGLNYKEHCDETKRPYPARPVVFSKFSSTIVGPFDDIVKPKCTDALDWEVELVVVIGKRAKDIAIADAYDYIFGYTMGQDVTARDWQEKNSGQFLLGKSMDTFCPLGPWIVTKDEIPDPHGLKLKTWVNGVVKQDGTTSQMIHRVDKLVSYISNVMTLFPGDIIMTGTPSGVGFARNPPEQLQPGDLVESEVEKIAKMANRVV